MVSPFLCFLCVGFLLVDDGEEEEDSKSSRLRLPLFAFADFLQKHRSLPSGLEHVGHLVFFCAAGVNKEAAVAPPLLLTVVVVVVEHSVGVETFCVASLLR